MTHYRMDQMTTQPLPLVIWRDSVCAGDDCDAPHERILHARLDESLDALLGRLLTERYVASISGGQATWVLVGRMPLAVVAQQWAQPRYLVQPSALLAGLIELNKRPHLNFLYRAQADPEQVVRQLLSDADKQS